MKRKREEGSEVRWLPEGFCEDEANRPPAAAPTPSRSRSRSRSRRRSRSRSRSSSPHPGASSSPSGQSDRPQLPPTSLFYLSLLKLHYGLQQVEPNLRHVVLMVNTLRRVQSSMELEAGPSEPPEPAPPQPPAPAAQATPPGSPHSRRRATVSQSPGTSDPHRAATEKRPSA